MSTKHFDALQNLEPRTRVQDARDMYLAHNGFTLASYAEHVAVINVFGWHVKIPNTAQRRRALPLHDLHHVVLGFGTDEVGEWELSAWEARTGLPGYGFFVHALVYQAFAVGLLFAPRRTLASWRSAKGQRSLYAAPILSDALLAMNVAELRAYLGVPVQGNAIAMPRLHSDAP